MTELVTLVELRRRGHVTEHITPNNVLGSKVCPKCNAYFSSSKDYTIHQRETKCSPRKPVLEVSPQSLERLGWKRYKSGEGEWIFRNQAPTLEKLLTRNGSTVIGAYQYTLSGGKFIGRRKRQW